MMRPRRPIGITILTMLQVVIGIVDILIGLLVILAYVVLAAFVGQTLIATGLLLLALLAFGLGVFSFVLAFGLWTGKGWAWSLSVIGATIGIALGVLEIIVIGFTVESIAYVVPIVLYVFMLIYLNTRTVKAYFGRTGGLMFPRAVVARPMGPPQPSPFAPPTQSYPQATIQQPPYAPQMPLPPIGVVPNFCPNCGLAVQPNVNFCDRCGTRLR